MQLQKRRIKEDNVKQFSFSTAIVYKDEEHSDFLKIKKTNSRHLSLLKDVGKPNCFNNVNGFKRYLTVLLSGALHFLSQLSPPISSRR